MSENMAMQGMVKQSAQAVRDPNISERISGLLDEVLGHAHENYALSAKLHQQLLGAADGLAEEEPETQPTDGFLGRVEGTLRVINRLLRNTENTSKAVLEQF